MKKNALLLTIAALFILFGNLYSQEITIGAKGGLSIPNLTGGSSVNPLSSGYSSGTGADGGIYAEYHITKPFSVSVGLEYSSQGGKKNGFQAYTTPAQIAPLFAPYPAPTYLYADFKSVAKLDYVLVPILARYTWKISKKSPFKIYAAFGPFAGFLLNAHQVTSGSSPISMMNPDGKTYTQLPIPPSTTPQSVSFDATTSIKDSLNTFNAGICGFVGISYSFNKKHTIFIEGGGNYGFLSIQKGTANGKNNTGAGVVTVGYAYTIPGKHKYTQSR